MKAAERRALVLRAAVVEFGRTGYEATSTASIARRVGVSQPYLFRLFESKKHLFTATADWSLTEMCRLMDEAAREAVREDRLGRYAELLAWPTSARRDLLRFELALYGAAGDPELAVVARRHFDSLWSQVARTTHAAEDELHAFFAGVSLMIVRALIDG
jgi:AcrR family transcriptional regulator